MTAIIIGIVVLLFVLAMGVFVGLARKQERERNHWNDNRLRRDRPRTYGTGSQWGASKARYPSNPNYDDGSAASYHIFTSSDSSFGSDSSSGGGCDSGSSGGDGGSCGGGDGGGGGD